MMIPPKINKAGSSFIALINLKLLKKAIAKNKASASITPISKAIAALKPLVILVSIRIKKTGPIIKLRKNPRVIPVNKPSNISYN